MGKSNGDHDLLDLIVATLHSTISANKTSFFDQSNGAVSFAQSRVYYPAWIYEAGLDMFRNVLYQGFRRIQGWHFRRWISHLLVGPLSFLLVLQCILPSSSRFFLQKRHFHKSDLTFTTNEYDSINRIERSSEHLGWICTCEKLVLCVSAWRESIIPKSVSLGVYACKYQRANPQPPPKHSHI